MERGFAIGWRQVFAVMMIMGCSAMVTSTYGIVVGPIAGEFKSSRMVLMLAITAMSISAGILSPIVGGLMDRSSLRRIMSVGIAGLVGGYLALSFVTSFGQVLVVFAVGMAAAQAMAGPIAGTVLLSRWFDKRRGAVLGIAISGIAAGTMIFPLVIQFLFDHFHWREALRVLALILAVCTIPALALIVNRPEDRGLHADGAQAPPAPAPGAPPPAAALTTGQIVTDPAFWLLALVVTTVLAGMMGAVTNIVPMARDLGTEANAAALIISVYAGTGFITKLGFGALADRLHPRVLMFVILAAFSAGMAALGFARTGYSTILLGAGLVGMGGMMIPLQSFLAPRIFGLQVVGKAVGLLGLASLCGLLAAPPIFGFIFDRTGSYSAIFFTFAALALAAMLVVPRIRLHPRQVVAPHTHEPRAEPSPTP